MKTTIQNLSKSQIELRIEVPADEFQGFMEKAVLSLGQNLEMKGFRKGKVPKEVVEQQISQDKILQEASQECIRENYLKAVKEQNLEPLGQPQIEILTPYHSERSGTGPFEFKAKIAILPEIKLPNYREVASQIKKRQVKVTDQELAKLQEEKERIEKERLRSEILEKIAEKSQMEIPEVLITSEKQRMLENIKQQVLQMLGISFEDYLRKIKKTENEMLDSFSLEAQKRVKNSLVLREIEKQEKIEVREQELQAEMDKIAKIDSLLDKNHLKEYAESVIKNEKILQLLESFTK